MRLTRRNLAISLAATVSACSAHLDVDVPSGQRQARVAILADALAGSNTPGMAALIIRDLSVEGEYVSGIRRVGGQEAARLGDRWHLGSNGKALTATLIARLVERATLSWQTPLTEMLPQLAATMHTDYRDVTLPDLLSHRAGLPENTSDMNLFASFATNRAPLPAQRLRYIDAALAEAPIAPKRANTSYSNTGYIIAAAAAEHATGQTFEALMASLVFEPLGMRSAGFELMSRSHEPVGHVDGRMADQLSDLNPAMFAPAGGMRMSMRDWARFCIDQMAGDRGDGRLLQTHVYRFLHTPQGETNSALGWGVAASPMGLHGPALTHSGSDGNWMALVVLFPETVSGVIVAANAADSMGGDRACARALRAFASEVAAAA